VVIFLFVVAQQAKKLNHIDISMFLRGALQHQYNQDLQLLKHGHRTSILFDYFDAHKHIVHVLQDCNTILNNNNSPFRILELNCNKNVHVYCINIREIMKHIQAIISSITSSNNDNNNYIAIVNVDESTTKLPELLSLANDEHNTILNIIAQQLQILCNDIIKAETTTTSNSPMQCNAPNMIDSCFINGVLLKYPCVYMFKKNFSVGNKQKNNETCLDMHPLMLFQLSVNLSDKESGTVAQFTAPQELELVVKRTLLFNAYQSSCQVKITTSIVKIPNVML